MHTHTLSLSHNPGAQFIACTVVDIPKPSWTLGGFKISAVYLVVVLSSTTLHILEDRVFLPSYTLLLTKVNFILSHTQLGPSARLVPSHSRKSGCLPAHAVRQFVCTTGELGANFDGACAVRELLCREGKWTIDRNTGFPFRTASHWRRSRHHIGGLLLYRVDTVRVALFLFFLSLCQCVVHDGELTATFSLCGSNHGVHRLKEKLPLRYTPVLQCCTSRIIYGRKIPRTRAINICKCIIISNSILNLCQVLVFQ